MESNETPEVTAPDAVETAVESEAPTPEPAPEPTPAPAPRPAANAAVTKEGIDPVRLSACVYKNTMAKKSLTVHHLQRRLNELGYHDAYADKDGWYGDLTRSSVEAYQKARGIADDGRPGMMNAATLEAIFSGDPNVYIADESR